MNKTFCSSCPSLGTACSDHYFVLAAPVGAHPNDSASASASDASTFRRPRPGRRPIHNKDRVGPANDDDVGRAAPQPPKVRAATGERSAHRRPASPSTNTCYRGGGGATGG
ncbi:hypothetical protein EDC01DRAFT_789054 [Geopyxis carbonaria]|nr:hypothetical protein EDC01DRAFT_789054 [Geopyxis carbonaria]